MDNKKLKRIGKKELLEILLSQAKKIEELERELKKSQKLLETKKISLEECGNLAEASLKLNKVFEVAQQSADQYLLNIQEKCKKIESDTKKSCEAEKEKVIKETKKSCEAEKDKIIKETEKICNKKRKQAEVYLKKAKESYEKKNSKKDNVKKTKKDTNKN